MNNPLRTGDHEEIQRLLMKEAGGSFHIVHMALSELANEKETRHLEVSDVIDKIHKLLGKQKIPA